MESIAKKTIIRTKIRRKEYRGKLVELTISDCEVSSNEALEILKTVFGDRLRRYQIVQEEHSGKHAPIGRHHLHIFLEFPKTTTIPLRRLEKKFGQWPHFDRIKNPSGFLGYIAKENMPLGNFDIFAEAWHYSGSKDMLVKSMLNAGWGIEAIISKFQNYLWKEDFPKYARKINMIWESEKIVGYHQMKGLAFIDDKLIRRTLSPKELREFYSFEGYLRLIEHLNDIKRYGFRQEHRPKMNLLIRGNTAIGKSRLFSEVMKYVSTYEFPIENWHPEYRDGLYRLILWDEPKMKPSLKEQYLKILDGLTCNLPIKGSHAVRQDHQKIILLSNLSLEKLAAQQRFDDDSQRAAFKRRLDEIDFGDRNLNFLRKLIKAAS